MELLKVYAALLRRKWLFIQAVVFFTLSAGVLAKVLPRKYEATAKIHVEASDASLSILGEMDLGEMASSLGGSSADLETMIALATMRPVLDEVVWRLQLRNQYLSNWGDGELLPAEKLLAPGIDGDILAMPWIEIDQQQGTDILVITATTNFPELSALLADTLVDVYLRASEEDAKRETREAGDFIKGALVNLQVQLDEALRNVADAQVREEIIDLDAELKAAVARTSELLSVQANSRAELADLRAQIRERGRQNSRESADRMSSTTTTTNDLLRSLRQALVELQLKRKQELQTKTEKHPDIKLMDSQIQTLQEQIEGALATQHSLDPSTQMMEMQAEGLEQRLAELHEEIQRNIQQFGSYPDKLRKIAQLQLSAEATEAIYQSLLEQEYEIAIAEAMTVSDMRQVEYSKIPEVPAAPKLLVYVLLGVFSGVAFGVGLVFLMEYIDDSIKSRDDLQGVWPLPVMGLVPHYKLKGGRFIDQAPSTDPIYEAFRNIRNAISFSSVDNPINVLTITSSAPGEGKSTFAMNLAICLSQDGLKVLVIDCDLRRPTQHKSFPSLSNERGVADVLAQKATAEEVTQITHIPTLSVITCGRTPDNPGQMVESLRLRAMVADLSRRYDFVIIDAPPVLAVGDAFSLGRASKGILLVVEWGVTGRRMLMDVRQRFEAAKSADPIGIVLNKVDTRSGNYGYYKKYANYYEEGKQKKGGSR